MSANGIIRNFKEHCYCDEWDNSACPGTNPPTIQVALTCEQWGNDDWCTGFLSLDLEATEPQGQEVLISGDVKGIAFACSPGNGSASCSIPLPEGTGSASFTATAISGLTAAGSIDYKRDSIQPEINGWLNGINGIDGWFTSSVDVNASASNPVPGSDIATFAYTLDGLNWENFPGTLNFSDGIHNLGLSTSDVAGNIVQTDQVIQVDTVTPVLNLSVTGATGTNGWYTSDVQVNVAASDSVSGVNSVNYDLDNAGWTAYTAPLNFSDGTHSLNLRVTDNAGNVTEGAKTFFIDTTPPEIKPSLTGTLGANGWYVSKVQIDADGLNKPRNGQNLKSRTV